MTDDRDASDTELRQEIVQIDAAYGAERFDIHLLPISGFASAPSARIRNRLLIAGRAVRPILYLCFRV